METQIDKTDRHPFLAHETSDMTLVYLLTKTVTDCTADQGQDSQELPGSPEHFWCITTSTEKHICQ